MQYIVLKNAFNALNINVIEADNLKYLLILTLSDFGFRLWSEFLRFGMFPSCTKCEIKYIAITVVATVNATDTMVMEQDSGNSAEAMAR